jgi:hypothetical protein
MRTAMRQGQDVVEVHVLDGDVRCCSRTLARLRWYQAAW